MIRVIILIVISLVMFTYFLKIENEYIQNYLACTLLTNQGKQNASAWIDKVKYRMPKTFPEARFEHLKKKILPQNTTPEPISCSVEKNRSFQNSILHTWRANLYPAFPDTISTLDLISVSQYFDRVALHQAGGFKKVIQQDLESFDRFEQDCARIKVIDEQIKLLEKHLKIDKNHREPSLVKSKFATVNRLSHNIAKQLAFARRHLANNEKIFSHKWKMFFDFESETTLCPR